MVTGAAAGARYYIHFRTESTLDMVTTQQGSTIQRYMLNIQGFPSRKKITQAIYLWGAF